MIDLRQITKLLAVEMTARSGQIWRAKFKGTWHASLYCGSAWLDISDNYNNRLKIQASRPLNMAWGKTGECITVDASRTPEAIAQDIERRLLPNAREVWQACREFSRENKRKEEEFRKTVHLFRKYKRLDRINKTHGEIYTKNCTVEIYNDKVTDLKIRHLTNEQALFILNYLEGE